MNNRRMIAILIVLLSLIILGAIIYFLFFYRNMQDTNIFRNQDTTGELTENLNVAEDVKQVVKIIPQKEIAEIPVATTAEINKANLIKMANSFAERFGSYSNHSDYENISDLKIFMSKKMIAWADDFVKTSRESSDYSDIYQGVITKAISAETRKFDENAGKAEILIKTQQIKSDGARGNSSTEYADILIVYVKEAGVWKVDGAYWQ